MSTYFKTAAVLRLRGDSDAAGLQVHISIRLNELLALYSVLAAIQKENKTQYFDFKLLQKLYVKTECISLPISIVFLIVPEK